MKTIMLTTVFVLGITTMAKAECVRSYVCDDNGQNCYYTDICDDPILDLPSLDVNPLPATPTLEIKPLPSLELPPLGASGCEYMQVNGEWQNVCR